MRFRDVGVCVETRKGNEKEVAFDTSFVASRDELRNELEPFTEFGVQEVWVLRWSTDEKVKELFCLI